MGILEHAVEVDDNECPECSSTSIIRTGYEKCQNYGEERLKGAETVCLDCGCKWWAIISDETGRFLKFELPDENIIDDVLEATEG